jgi:hypothetical protein
MLSTRTACSRVLRARVSGLMSPRFAGTILIETPLRGAFGGAGLRPVIVPHASRLVTPKQHRQTAVPRHRVAPAVHHRRLPDIAVRKPLTRQLCAPSPPLPCRSAGSTPLREVPVSQTAETGPTFPRRVRADIFAPLPLRKMPHSLRRPIPPHANCASVLAQAGKSPWANAAPAPQHNGGRLRPFSSGYDARAIRLAPALLGLR